MTMQAPSLAKIGTKLWGPRWAEPLAGALNVTHQTVVEWDAKPETRPADLESRMGAIANARLDEIQRVLAEFHPRGQA